MSLAAAIMIGLAKLAVSPVRMPHGRRFELGLKHRHKQQSAPAFRRRIWPGWMDSQPRRYMGCAWSPFSASIYSIERRRAVGSLAPCCSCCEGFE